MCCYNSTLPTFMMPCFRFPETHARIILRRIRDTRQYDFLCTAPLQLPSEYFRNFNTLRCCSQEYVFLRNYKDLNLVCVISLSLCSVDLFIFQSVQGSCCSMNQCDLVNLGFPLLTFISTYFSCLCSHHNLEVLWVLIWQKLYECQD